MSSNSVDTAELSACPMCGGESHITKGYATEQVWPHGDFHRVFCGCCQLRQLFYRTSEEAIAAWNRRTPQADEVRTGKSLNAQVADLLRPFLKEGQKVIWREPFRWHDDNGVLSNHYDGFSIEGLAEDFEYEVPYDFNFGHAAIVGPRTAAADEVRDAALEEAAKACEVQNDTDWPTPLGCAKAIRDLKRTAQ